MLQGEKFSFQNGFIDYSLIISSVYRWMARKAYRCVFTVYIEEYGQLRNIGYLSSTGVVQSLLSIGPSNNWIMNNSNNPI